MTYVLLDAGHPWQSTAILATLGKDMADVTTTDNDETRRISVYELSAAVLQRRTQIEDLIMNTKSSVVTVAFLTLALLSCGVEDRVPQPIYSTQNTKCGNGAIDGHEVCDGLDFGEETCLSQGMGSGNLRCKPGCAALDFSECAGCVPECGTRVCGPDPVCGVSCGPCAGGTCNNAGQCITDCVPECGTRVCGPDPVCGVSCGLCDDGTCNNAGQCITGCVPACGDRVCGPDPVCGVSCGPCSEGTCNNAGQCITGCVPACGDRVCGLDPVCGTSCGSCTDGVCNGAGQCIPNCIPNCDDRVCGPDPVCGVSCGPCNDGECNSAGQCVPTCTPNCGARVCGPDPVCGESCGVCLNGACTEDGTCPSVDAQLVVTLEWDNAADLDLSLRLEPGHYCGLDTCYWENCTLEDTQRPNWDSLSGFSSGDPMLEVDDADGYGPEVLSVEDLIAGDFVIAVHHFPSLSNSLTLSLATVRVYVDGALQFEESRSMAREDLWEVALVSNWGTTPGSVPLSTIQRGWSCDSQSLECSEHAQCEVLEYCTVTGYCAFGCRNDNSCMPGLVCSASHQCVEEGTLGDWQDPCTSSDECGAGLYCCPFWSHCCELCMVPAVACDGDSSCCPASGAAYCAELISGIGYCADHL